MGDDGLGKNLTGCSGHDLLFSFNPSRVLQHESGNDTNLADLGWPTAISDDFKTFSITNQAMGVFYVIGAGIAGIAMLIRLGLLITRRSRQSIFEVASLLVSYPYIIHIWNMWNVRVYANGTTRLVLSASESPRSSQRFSASNSSTWSTPTAANPT